MKETAYDQGFSAYQNDADVSDNPYKQSSFDYQDWEDGYYDAMNEDLKNFG